MTEAGSNHSAPAGCRGTPRKRIADLEAALAQAQAERDWFRDELDEATGTLAIVRREAEQLRAMRMQIEGARAEIAFADTGAFALVHLIDAVLPDDEAREAVSFTAYALWSAIEGARKALIE